MLRAVAILALGSLMAGAVNAGGCGDGDCSVGGTSAEMSGANVSAGHTEQPGNPRIGASGVENDRFSAGNFVRVTTEGGGITVESGSGILSGSPTPE